MESVQENKHFTSWQSPSGSNLLVQKVVASCVPHAGPEAYVKGRPGPARADKTQPRTATLRSNLLTSAHVKETPSQTGEDTRQHAANYGEEPAPTGWSRLELNYCVGRGAADCHDKALSGEALSAPAALIGSLMKSPTVYLTGGKGGRPVCTHQTHLGVKYQRRGLRRPSLAEFNKSLKADHIKRVMYFHCRIVNSGEPCFTRAISSGLGGTAALFKGCLASTSADKKLNIHDSVTYYGGD